MEKFHEQWNFSMIAQGAASHMVHSANEQQGSQDENIQGIRTRLHHV
jgi:hypothetical protein